MKLHSIEWILFRIPTGKTIAEGRHQYMVDFLEQFYSEWEGEK